MFFSSHLFGLPGNGVDLTEHDKGVGVHSGDTSEGLARLVGSQAEGHLGVEDNLRGISGLNERDSLSLDSSGALSLLPLDLSELARGLGGTDVHRRGESSLEASS